MVIALVLVDIFHSACLLAILCSSPLFSSSGGGACCVLFCFYFNSLNYYCCSSSPSSSSLSPYSSSPFTDTNYTVDLALTTKQLKPLIRRKSGSA